MSKPLKRTVPLTPVLLIGCALQMPAASGCTTLFLGAFIGPTSCIGISVSMDSPITTCIGGQSRELRRARAGLLHSFRDGMVLGSGAWALEFLPACVPPCRFRAH